MRKYVLILIGLFIAAVIAGCGGGSTTAPTILSGSTTAQITASDVANKTFISTIDGTTFAFSAFGNHSSVTWGGHSGKWQITGGSNLVLTDSSTNPITQQTLTFIQKEGTISPYWLVYDPGTKTNARIYIDVPVPSDYDPTLMGGARIGVPTPSILTQVTLFSGSLTSSPGVVPGAGGFTFSNSTTATTSAARFNQPLDATYDGSSYFVLDFVNNAIRRIDTAGNVTTIKLIDSSTKLPVFLSSPQGITTDGTSLFVADTGNHVIRKVDIVNVSTGVTTILTGESSIIAGTLVTAGSIDTLTPAATPAKFNSPTGITTDGTNLYVADSGNHTIRKIQISTKNVTTLAGFAGHIGSSDGVSTDARFNSPVRLTTNGSNLFVSDFNNRTIRSIQIATGTVTTLAGNASSKAAQVDATTGSAASFYHPSGITTDGTNLYVTDFNNIILPKPGAAITDANRFSNLIRKIVISTGAVTTVAGGKSYPEDAVEGNLTTARFASPRGIVWDGTNLLVTNGTYSFTTDGVSISNQTSAYNVIFKVPPTLL